MPDAVRDAYAARAREYADFACDDLERVAHDRARLGAFAGLVAHDDGAVAELGCGPGLVVAHLEARGVRCVGVDFAPEMIEEARRRFPASTFRLGDLRVLDFATGSLAGIVSRYSLIHAPPECFAAVFAEWHRALAPRAPVLVSFFAAGAAGAHGRPFDHAVVTAYELFPATVAAQLERAGFDGLDVSMRPPLDGERALDHATILARRASR